MGGVKSVLGCGGSKGRCGSVRKCRGRCGRVGPYGVNVEAVGKYVGVGEGSFGGRCEDWLGEVCRDVGREV